MTLATPSVSSYQKIKAKLFVDILRCGNIFGGKTTNGDYVSHILNLFYLFNVSSSKKVPARRTAAYRHNKQYIYIYIYIYTHLKHFQTTRSIYRGDRV
jgi:hypothetical protein